MLQNKKMAIAVVSTIIASLVSVRSDSIPKGALRQLPDNLRAETNMTTPELIMKYNYPFELHHVVTEDGYVLALHRIPTTKNSTKGTVLVMHGLLSSSADWVIMGPKKGLGYILADKGYDVWLGNARGNIYSRNHTKLNTKTRKFWNFSWHEIGYYDIPSMIDYIIDITKEEKIFHIGHSQGTTSYYVMTSTRPSYNEKIRAHFSLAPVAFCRHMVSPFMKLLSKHTFFLQPAANIVGLKEFLPNGGIASLLGKILCGVDSINKIVCQNILFLIAGFNSKEMNTTMLPLILSHVPSGSSTKQFLHYSQLINSGKFRQYDYGLTRNLKKYKSWRPPNYDLKEITSPMYIFYSRNDWLSSARDVKKLFRKVRHSLRGKLLVKDRHFEHLDYLYGLDAPRLVYKKIVRLMKKHKLEKNKF